jgi:amidase
VSRTPTRFRRRTVLKAGAALALSACTSRLVTPARPAGADPFVDDDAIELARRVRNHEVTPLELVDLVIARIEALEGSLNAITTRTFERARTRAATIPLDAPFAGVPFLIKDMIDCAGVPRTDGAHAVFERTPAESPAYMKAVEASGLNIVGVTNVPEFATLPTTVNLRSGATANPWDPTRTPAGSSGGTAAAVAAGYVPLAHGTDGAGSIRLPSSYCGVFGFKPSRERTLSGEAHGGHDLVKHHHAISRSVRDSALLLSLTEDVASTARYAPIGFVRGEASRGERVRRRIGVDRGGVAGLTPDAETSKALDAAAKLLASLGHEVFEMPPLPLSPDEFWEHLEAHFFARTPGLMRLTEALTGEPFEETSVLSPFTMSFVRLGAVRAPGARERVVAYFRRLERELVAWMDGVDAVLSPVQPIVQPAIDVYSPDSTWQVESPSMRAFMNYTGLANATGAPAMSVPLHWTAEGLPLGSQLLARPGDDRLLLELAYDLERARPWKARWAPLSVRFL